MCVCLCLCLCVCECMWVVHKMNKNLKIYKFICLSKNFAEKQKLQNLFL